MKSKSVFSCSNTWSVLLSYDSSVPGSGPRSSVTRWICPQLLIDKLRNSEGSCTTYLSGKKKKKELDHVQPIFRSSYWLPIRARIQYKVSTLCFSVITGTGPQYPSELLHLYSPSRDLRSSADTRILKIPRATSEAFGQRLFSHIGPSTWNGLPYSLRHSDSQTSFRQALKTYLF